MRVPALGRATALVAVLALVGARLTGWTEAGALGVGLGAVLLVSALALLGRPRLAVTLRLTDERVVVGARAVGTVDVHLRGRLPSAGRRLQVPVGDAVAELPVPALPAGGTHSELVAVPTARRGVLRVGPVSSVRGDALGLLTRTVRWTEPVDLLVHPRTLPFTTSTAGLLRDLEGVATPELTPGGLQFHALREYAPGDDLRSVHWRTSARTSARGGALMVRQDQDHRRSRTAVLLAGDPGDWASDDERETGVEVVATLGLQALRDGRELSVLAGGGLLPAGSGAALLDACARLDPAGPGLDRLASLAARAVPSATLVVLVTGSTRGEEAVHRAAAGLPAGARAAVVVCGAAEPSLRRRGRLQVARLRSLEDLPLLALRRVR